MTDYIDKLTHSEQEDARQTATLNFMGIPMLRAMAVGERAASSEEMEANEAEWIASLNSSGELPLTWWDSDTGAPEPLRARDYALLEAAGIDPTEWQILIIEEHLERGA